MTLSEDQVATIAEIFARKAIRFGVPCDVNTLAQALQTVVVDTELLVTDSVAYEVWVEAARGEGWIR